jgi:mRNA interferase RelE/StbE
MEYTLSSNAVHSLKKLAHAERNRIFTKLDFFFHTKSPLKFADHLHGVASGCYRFRIGDYRVVFDVKSGTARILLIGHRKDIYK